MSIENQKPVYTGNNGITPYIELTTRILEHGGRLLASSRVSNIRDSFIELWMLRGEVIVIQKWIKTGGYKMYMETDAETVEGDKARIDMICLSHDKRIMTGDK